MESGALGGRLGQYKAFIMLGMLHMKVHYRQLSDFMPLYQPIKHNDLLKQAN
ncbi:MULTISPECIES: hypothetical protein [Aneurinibacillus]|uniref:hypothetical protein n=1 Tax=Aneurinibacillus TaxID=55079 RepID=UPI000A96FE38|nr:MULTISPECIES: hypothetical protein [Aneurinibacillus]